MEEIYRSITGSWKLVFPELALLGLAALMFLGSLYSQRRIVWAVLGLGGLVWAGIAWFMQMPGSVSLEIIPSASLFTHDNWRWLGRGLVYATGILLIMTLWSQVAEARAAEFFACVLSMVAGAGMVMAAYDLVSLFLSLEIVSFSTYIVLYILRRDNLGLEATVKYFLLSIFSSAIFLFGVSLLYMSGGRTNYFLLRLQLLNAGANSSLLLAGLFILGGLGFRVAAVPFHFYAPDVFAGTHPGGAALLAVLPKIVGLAAMYQLLVELFSAASRVPQGTLDVLALLLLTIAVLAGASMLLGNLGGLVQDEIYRLLAYSSIAHAGYLLVGLAAGTGGKPIAGNEALVFYLGTYILMTLGMFAGLLCARQEGKLLGYIDELSGLGRSRPFLALCLAVGLLSLTGLPPTVGFWGKVAVIVAAWNAPSGQTTLRYLAIFLVLNAAVGAWYYLRILGVMYLRQPVRPFDAVRKEPAWWACLACTAITVVLFFVPNLWWKAVAWAFRVS